MKLETIEDEKATVSPNKLINSRAMREMFGISKMTQHRWQKNPDLGFPKPIEINRRLFWREAELIDFINERSRGNE